MEKDKIIGVIDLIEQGIENGSLKVEEVHRKIAEKPWIIISKIGPLSIISDEVLGIQEQIIGNTYHSVRKLSNYIARNLTNMISKKI